MRRTLTGLLALAMVACSGLAAPTATKPATPKPGAYTGTIGKALYKVDIPAHWNGTLLLYSHGYTAPGSTLNPTDSGDPATAQWLLGQGFALAGSSYSSTGWALADAFNDQVALLDEFGRRFARPRRTVAWGHSLGGIITAGLVQLHPERFAGAVPMCGVLGGSVGNWNGALDLGFAFKTLLAPGSALQLVRISDGKANNDLAQSLLRSAQATPAGQARLSLVAALGQLPGWFNPLAPEPAAADLTAQESNQAQWMQTDFGYEFAYRAELESRAGGNPSWNTGFDYSGELAASPARDEVAGLYQRAGLDLSADLAALHDAPRIAPDAAAVAYLARNVTFDGKLGLPIVTLHSTGDGLVVAANERAYQDVVQAAGDGGQLRQVFVHRANHCIFTPAEQVAAFQVLFERLDGGSWPATSAAALNARALALGDALNGGGLPGSGIRLKLGPSFVDYAPAAFPRQFDNRTARP